MIEVREVVKVLLTAAARLACATFLIALLLPLHVSACESDVPCSKCPRDSEFSWNPSNQFVSHRLARFYQIDGELTAAYAAGNVSQVQSLASEYLNLASIYRCNWNYGNAIHDANRLLGLISLKNGDTDAAAKYLVASGKTPGSPQLDTFGPELDLANAVLHEGKVDAAKTYLTDIKSFWEMDNGQIDSWLVQIEANEQPQLNRYAGLGLSPWFLLVFALMMAWPFILATAILLLLRNRLSRKGLYFAVSVITGYVVMFLTTLIAGFAAQLFASKSEKFDETSILIIGYLPIALAIFLPAVVMFVVARFFRSDQLGQSR